MVMEFRLGNVLTLKKPHACGGTQWRVERLGADIGLRCLRCRHYVMVPRAKLERRVRSVVLSLASPTIAGKSDSAGGHSDQ